MALEFRENQGWVWTGGSIHDLVAAVGDGDARLGFVTDLKSGAKISMNINGVDDSDADPETVEPFYVESPDGENMYDAYNRKEAVNLLTAARMGKQDLDEFQFTAPKAAREPRAKKPAKRSSRSRQVDSSLGSMR